MKGDRYQFTVKMGTPPHGAKNGTKLDGRGANFSCLISGTPIEANISMQKARRGGWVRRLMAVVAEGARGRVYLAPTQEMEVSPQWPNQLGNLN